MAIQSAVAPLQRFNDLTIQRGKANFPRNSRSDFAQYTSERPPDFAKATTAKEGRKAKATNKGNQYEKRKHTHNNSAGARLLCALAGGSSA
jgi:hypothetical protein